LDQPISSSPRPRPAAGRGHVQRDPLPADAADLPPLGDVFWTPLRAGLAALETAYGDVGAVSEAQLGTIADHVRLLLAWNEAINLSGIRTPAAIAVQHVLDSLAALPILRRAGVESFLDIGSGGGYPGLPLAIALPARRALLVESVGKKARFLATVVEAAGLHERVAVAATRAETLAADPHHRGRWPAVVSRAVAETGELIELALPLLRVGGLLVAWKRAPAEDELDAAGSSLRQLRGRLVRLDTMSLPGLEDHVLAVVEKIGESPAQYPRDPAVRRRRPL